MRIHTHARTARRLHHLTTATLWCIVATTLSAQNKPRENTLRLPIGGVPGALDAITDVAGVEVGHTTLIAGSGALIVGKGPVRDGRASARTRKCGPGLRVVVHVERQR
jgi:D-aminopeptidase